MTPRSITVVALLTCLYGAAALTENAAYWRQSGEDRLEQVLRQRNNVNHAKNVIIFIGDGMGMTTITASRIYKGQTEGGKGEDYELSFEKFPHIGLSKTYNVDRQVPDSAGTATALFSGVKGNYQMLGYDSTPSYNVCDSNINKASEVASIMMWAQNAGKHTGVVTTTRITHATPAALYAHSNNRDWECDSIVPAAYKDCTQDIARQLVENLPGREMRVVLGGGQKQMGVTVESGDEDSCVREDGRNLAEEWSSRSGRVLVSNKADLMGVDLNTTLYLMGLFSPGHLPYGPVRTEEHPSLVNMTTQAIRLLARNLQGYVLLVEGGRIDHAHHGNYAKLALREAAEFDDAIAAAVAMTNDNETLIVVTADHSHAFTINGYPDRGNDILGLANKTATETPYETLSYANGPAFIYHRLNDSTGSPNQTWRDITKVDRKDIYYRNFAPIYSKDETHGGEDVPVYSKGPFGHLLTGVFEQNFIAHAVSFSACIGPAAKFCVSPDHTTESYLEKYNYSTVTQKPLKHAGSASNMATTSVSVTTVLVSLCLLANHRF